MTEQTWIIECLKIMKISDNIRNLITKAMEKWKVGLATGGWLVVFCSISTLDGYLMPNPIHTYISILYDLQTNTS